MNALARFRKEEGVQDYHLVSHQLCPYVQRAVILMHEKSIGFRRTDIVLSDKPDWFLKLSPTQKVPILIIERKGVLFEAQAICEYLDDVSAGSLHADQPFERAQHRAIIAVGEEVLSTIARLIYRDTSKKNIDDSANNIKRQLELVATQERLSPYFSGERFLMVDAVFATIFRYFPVLEPLLGVLFLKHLPRLAAWREALSARASVIDAVPREYEALLVKFIAQQSSALSDLVRVRHVHQ